MFSKINLFTAISLLLLSPGFGLDIVTENYSITLGDGWSVEDAGMGDSNIVNGDYSIEIAYFETSQEQNATHLINVEVITTFGGTVTEEGDKTLGDYTAEIHDYSLTFMDVTTVGRFYQIESPNGYISITLESDGATIDPAIITEIEAAIGAMEIMMSSSIAHYDFKSIKATIGGRQITFGVNSGVDRVEAYSLDGARVRLLHPDKHTWAYPQAVLPVVLRVSSDRGSHTWLVKD